MASAVNYFPATFANLPYSIHIQNISLPLGYFPVYLPIQEKISVEYLALRQQVAHAPFPYWARLWPSAIALSSFLQKHPQLVADKLVAELAAGVGLPSLVAATYARRVWCSDISNEAMQVAAKSASMLQVYNIQFEACNWSYLPADFIAEVVLLSDINYEPSVFDELEKVLTGLLQRGCTLLLSTPQRLLAKPFLARLSVFISNSHEERVEADGQITFVSIFVLRLISGKNE